RRRSTPPRPGRTWPATGVSPSTTPGPASRSGSASRPAFLSPGRRPPLAMSGGRRHVQGGVAVEEAGRLEHESAAGDRHDGPVLRAWHVRGAERVPDHDVLAVDIAVPRDEGRQARPARVLVHEVT